LSDFETKPINQYEHFGVKRMGEPWFSMKEEAKE
jgi:hypothetical protein